MNRSLLVAVGLAVAACGKDPRSFKCSVVSSGLTASTPDGGGSGPVHVTGCDYKRRSADSSKSCSGGTGDITTIGMFGATYGDDGGLELLVNQSYDIGIGAPPAFGTFSASSTRCPTAKQFNGAESGTLQISGDGWPDPLADSTPPSSDLTFMIETVLEPAAGSTKVSGSAVLRITPVGGASTGGTGGSDVVCATFSDNFGRPACSCLPPSQVPAGLSPQPSCPAIDCCLKFDPPLQGVTCECNSEASNVANGRGRTCSDAAALANATMVSSCP